MKIYKNTVIVLSVIIGISVAVFNNLISPVAIAAYTNSITEEDYQMLKNYALEVAKNSDIRLNNKDINVTITELNAETLTMDINKEIYGVEASYHISELTWKIEQGIMKYDMVIDYDNVTFSEYTDVDPVWYYIILSILLVALCVVGMYSFLYLIPSSIVDSVKYRNG